MMERNKKDWPESESRIQANIRKILKPSKSCYEHWLSLVDRSRVTRPNQRLISPCNFTFESHKLLIVEQILLVSTLEMYRRKGGEYAYCVGVCPLWVHDWPLSRLWSWLTIPKIVNLGTDYTLSIKVLFSEVTHGALLVIQLKKNEMWFYCDSLEICSRRGISKTTRNKRTAQ